MAKPIVLAKIRGVDPCGLPPVDFKKVCNDMENELFRKFNGEYNVVCMPMLPYDSKEEFTMEVFNVSDDSKITVEELKDQIYATLVSQKLLWQSIMPEVKIEDVDSGKWFVKSQIGIPVTAPSFPAASPASQHSTIEAWAGHELKKLESDLDNGYITKDIYGIQARNIHKEYLYRKQQENVGKIQPPITLSSLIMKYKI